MKRSILAVVLAAACTFVAASAALADGCTHVPRPLVADIEGITHVPRPLLAEGTHVPRPLRTGECPCRCCPPDKSAEAAVADISPWVPRPLSQPRPAFADASGLTPVRRPLFA